MTFQKFWAGRVVSLSLLVIVTITTNLWAQHEQSYSFYGSNGAEPPGGLIVDSAGNFYGVTAFGGTAACYQAAGCGTVFELSPTSGPNAKWTESVLYSFENATGTGGDGVQPQASLVFDRSGNLYGVCLGGGAFNAGTIFELSPPPGQVGPWTETILHNFTGSDYDEYPKTTPIFDQAGNLYGTTGAVVWELSPPSSGGTWTYAILQSFAGGTNGAAPQGPLVFDSAGNLYGTAQGGGLYNSGGTVFELSPPPTGGGGWTVAVLHNFACINGCVPNGGLILRKSGSLIGTAFLGGPSGGGVFFGLLPPSSPGGEWNYSILHDFGAKGDGDWPMGTLAETSSGTFYGATEYSYEITNYGTVYEMVPPPSPGGAWTESVIYNFNSTSGGAPTGGVVLQDQELWGTTLGGGRANLGTVFRISQ